MAVVSRIAWLLVVVDSKPNEDMPPGATQSAQRTASRTSNDVSPGRLEPVNNMYAYAMNQMNYDRAAELSP